MCTTNSMRNTVARYIIIVRILSQSEDNSLRFDCNTEEKVEANQTGIFPKSSNKSTRVTFRYSIKAL